MRFYKFTLAQITDAADSLTYPAGVYFSHTSTRSNVINGTLRVRDSFKEGARMSASGRHMPAASWEAHRDFMRALFAVNPAGRITTALADYRGADDFERKHAATANHNCGSQCQPATMAELSVY